MAGIAVLHKGKGQPQRRRVLGLMSGTSLDGIDVIDVSLQGSGAPGHPGGVLEFVVHNSCCLPFAADAEQAAQIQAEILAGMSGTTREICRLNTRLGAVFAQAILRYLEDYSIDPKSIGAIGSHGQTLHHIHGESTLQLGDGDLIAQQTGILTVSDFRMSDIAVGGCGAPLVPYLDRLLARRVFPGREQESVAFQNLGGIGNLCFVPAEKKAPILAFDTGPANILLNALVRTYFADQDDCDRNARFSQQGRVHEECLADMLDHPFFALCPPKSAGHENFGADYLRQLLGRWAGVLSPPDLLRTAVACTARSIADAYQNFLPALPNRLFLSGGGAQHPLIVADLQALLPTVRFGNFTQEFGLDPDAKEALLMAVLAHERLTSLSANTPIPTNVPAATGARRAVGLGKLSFPG